MTFAKFNDLLALTNPLKAGRSVLEWAPFVGGEILGSIIERYNASCWQSYKSINWTDEDIADQVYGIRVLENDLSRITELGKSEFAKILILLFDLDPVRSSADALPYVRSRMDSNRFRRYYLAQVGGVAGAKPVTPELKFARVIPFQPVPIRDQEELEKNLNRLCEAYQVAIVTSNDVLPSSAANRPTTHGVGPVTAHMFSTQDYLERISQHNLSVPKDFRKGLVTLAEAVRDAAIIQDLSPAQTKALAHRAVAQQFALSRITEQLQISAADRIVLDAIRVPIFQMPTTITLKKPVWQQVDLVAVSPKRRLSELSSRQQSALANLGVRGTTFTTVHFDEPGLREHLKPLKGAVEIIRLRSDLPVGMHSVGSPKGFTKK